MSSSSSAAFTIPNLQRITYFTCKSPRKVVELAYVNKLFKEAIVDFDTAQLIWDRLSILAKKKGKKVGNDDDDDDEKNVDDKDDGFFRRDPVQEFLEGIIIGKNENDDDEKKKKVGANKDGNNESDDDDDAQNEEEKLRSWIHRNEIIFRGGAAAERVTSYSVTSADNNKTQQQQQEKKPNAVVELTWIIQLMLEHTKTRVFFRTPDPWIIRKGFADSFCPLHFAIKHSKPEIVKTILDYAIQHRTSLKAQHDRATEIATDTTANNNTTTTTPRSETKFEDEELVRATPIPAVIKSQLCPQKPHGQTKLVECCSTADVPTLKVIINALRKLSSKGEHLINNFLFNVKNRQSRTLFQDLIWDMVELSRSGEQGFPHHHRNQDNARVEIIEKIKFLLDVAEKLGCVKELLNHREGSGQKLLPIEAAASIISGNYMTCELFNLLTSRIPEKDRRDYFLAQYNEIEQGGGVIYRAVSNNSTISTSPILRLKNLLEFAKELGIMKDVISVSHVSATTSSNFSTSPNFRTPIALACFAGDVEKVKLLIALGNESEHEWKRMLDSPDNKIDVAFPGQDSKTVGLIEYHTRYHVQKEVSAILEKPNCYEYCRKWLEGLKLKQ